MVISSTTNEWPQQEQIDETGMMASSGRLMEKQAQEQQPLKCPRCDSSNTKFCYYNNYSLSQPRHFCKACKRYWTRGGTLRNVPVGGGFRKNKRVKRSATSTDPPSLSSPTPTPLIDTSTPSNPINRWFYGLPTSHSDMNLPFPSFHSRVSNVDTMPTSCTSYDLQTQLNALGLGFGPTSQIQDGISTNSILSNYSLLGSSSSPTTASLLASSLQPQKLVLGGLKERDPSNYFQAFLPFENLQTAGKEVKMEEGNHRMSQNPIEAVGLLDPSPYWNMTGVGAWPDHSNFGSSVTPLI